MAKYFVPTVPADKRNYAVTRRRKNGSLVRDQLPFEGVYTEHEMAQIVDAARIPGEWVELKRRELVIVFGLRQRRTA